MPDHKPLDWEKVIQSLNSDIAFWIQKRDHGPIIAGVLAGLRDAIKAGLKPNGEQT